VKKKTFRTSAAAERWATRTEAAIIDGKEIPTAAAERRKLAAVLDAYMAEALAGLRAAANRRAQLEWWKDRLGPIPVLRLRRENVRQQLAALERGEGPSGRPVTGATRRRYLAALRAALGWAERRDLVTANVARGAAPSARRRACQSGAPAAPVPQAGGPSPRRRPRAVPSARHRSESACDREPRRPSARGGSRSGSASSSAGWPEDADAVTSAIRNSSPEASGHQHRTPSPRFSQPTRPSNLSQMRLPDRRR
jgi:hypothetical protein